MTIESLSYGNKSNKSPLRTRMVLEAIKLGFIGNSRTEITGVDQLECALNPPGSESTGGVVASSHITNIDIPLTTLFASKYADVAVTSMSTNFGVWHQDFVYTIAGKNRVLPVEYEQQTNGNLTPKRFDPASYNRLAEAVSLDKRALVVAAHNPTTHDTRLKVGELPPVERAGVLPSYVSLTTGGTPIIPSLVEVEGQREHPKWNNEDKLDLAFVLRRKNVHVGFGKGIVPDTSDVSRYQELTNDPGKSDIAERCGRIEGREVLKKYGIQVMQSLHGMQKY